VAQPSSRGDGVGARDRGAGLAQRIPASRWTGQSADRAVGGERMKPEGCGMKSSPMTTWALRYLHKLTFTKKLGVLPFRVMEHWLTKLRHKQREGGSYGSPQRPGHCPTWIRRMVGPEKCILSSKNGPIAC
jgi:hypothetical protein